ncbi:MAG: SIS domain-containing protein [Gammaproteobacteria bacterium]|nr:SIS domain-containing protein [Gammaproteobacteria bacterium]
MDEQALAARLRRHFEDSIGTQRQTLQALLPRLAAASRALADALAGGAKVLICGNGGSAADAQHFAAELTGRFERERPGLPAIALTTDTSALTAIGNDYAFEQVFARQVQALARPGDWLLAISTSGNSANVVAAIAAMQAKRGRVLALTGRDGGAVAGRLRATDFELRAASSNTARVQETHILLLHCLCDAVDELLYPAA